MNFKQSDLFADFIQFTLILLDKIPKKVVFKVIYVLKNIG